MSPSRPTRRLSLSHLRPRGLVNSGNMCFAIAVLQLLVHSPPSWNLFKKLRELKEQWALKNLENCGGVTPLVDATIRFFAEFTSEEKMSPSAPHGNPNEGEEKGKNNRLVNSFNPTYLYDVMKESGQLKTLLVSFHTHVAPSCH